MKIGELNDPCDAPPPTPCAELPALNAELPTDFLAFNENRRRERDPRGPRVLTYYVHEGGTRSLFRPTGPARAPGTIVRFGDFDGPCGDPKCKACVTKEAEVEAHVQREIARMMYS